MANLGGVLARVPVRPVPEVAQTTASSLGCAIAHDGMGWKMATRPPLASVRTRQERSLSNDGFKGLAYRVSCGSPNCSSVRSRCEAAAHAIRVSRPVFELASTD